MGCDELDDRHLRFTNNGDLVRQTRAFDDVREDVEDSVRPVVRHNIR